MNVNLCGFVHISVGIVTAGVVFGMYRIERQRRLRQMEGSAPPPAPSTAERNSLVHNAVSSPVDPAAPSGLSASGTGGGLVYNGL